MGRAILVLLLVIVALSTVAPLASALAAKSNEVILSGVAGPDGLAFIHAVLPPGKYSIVSILGAKGSTRVAAPAPMLLSFLPDPSLWQRLREVTVIGPVMTPVTRFISTGSGVEFVAWIPARPGAKVSIVLEKLGSGKSRGDTRPGMVIIVPDDPLLIAAAKKIASIHEGQGISVKIVTTTSIYRDYGPAKPPLTMCKDLPKEYNKSLALRILSFVKSLRGSNVKYILLIGSAKDVPPIYYCSPTLRELVAPKEGVVPSDYYYADPDGDGIVDFAVGRIPFSDSAKLAAYINSLEAWAKGGDWLHKAFLAGGAPFATDLFVGESAVLSTLEEIGNLGLRVSELLLSTPGYVATSFSAFIGKYGLYYLVVHGTGSAMLDYVPGGLWNYNFEEKLTTRQVPYTSHPGVYLTPACRVAYWDYDLFNPPFTPPSIAVAMLVRGAAVAFIGSSRVAVEAIDSIQLGLSGASLSFAGADAPLQLFLSMLPGSETLGDAWARALNAYLASPKSKYKVYLTSGEEEIGSLIIHEMEFLGDPAAPNPWSKSLGATSTAPSITPPLGSLNVDASIIAMPLAKYVTGVLPAYNPGPRTSISFTINHGCPEDIEAKALVRIEGYLLIGLRDIEVNASMTNNECRVTLRVPWSAPSTIRVLALWGSTAAAYYFVVGGAYLDKEHKTLVLRGLDALETIGDEPLLVELNNTVKTLVPGGATSYNISLSLLASSGNGVYRVLVTPAYRYDVIYGGELVAKAIQELRGLYTVSWNGTASPTKHSGTPMFSEKPGLPLPPSLASSGAVSPSKEEQLMSRDYEEAIIGLLSITIFLLSLLLITKKH